MKKLLSIAGAVVAVAGMTLGAVAPAVAAVDPVACANAPVREACRVPFQFPEAVPATPTSDGSLPFLDWPHPGVNADSEKGYRAPNGQYDIYLDRVYDGPGTYLATVYKRGGYLLGDEAKTASGSQHSYTVQSKDRFLTPAAPTLKDVAGFKNDEAVFPPAVNGSYKVSSVTDMKDGTTRFRVAFTPDPGYVLAPKGSWNQIVDGKAVWLLYADRGDTVTPAAPTVLDVSGYKDDKAVFPADQVHGSYKVSSITDMKDGTTRFRLAFTPEEGYSLTATGSWDRVVDGKAVWLIYASRADTTISVPEDFIAGVSDTRATGHYELAGTGLRIWTEGATSTDKVAEYVLTSTPLSKVGSPSLDYTPTVGTVPPGFQLFVDFDGNGVSDGILVGEKIYGADWWLSNSAAQFAKDGAPRTGGGSGSSWFGTLDEWSAGFPNAKVVAFGFSLGSGVHGDGILHSIQFAGHTYTFED